MQDKLIKRLKTDGFFNYDSLSVYLPFFENNDPVELYRLCLEIFQITKQVISEEEKELHQFINNLLPAFLHLSAIKYDWTNFDHPRVPTKMADIFGQSPFCYPIRAIQNIDYLFEHSDSYYDNEFYPNSLKLLSKLRRLFFQLHLIEAKAERELTKLEVSYLEEIKEAS